MEELQTPVFYISHGGYNPGSQTIAGIRNNSGSPVFNAKNGGTVYFNRDVTAADVAFQYNSGGKTHLYLFLVVVMLV
jgi:hypothetical protein